MGQRIRRIVTGHDGDGRSVFIADGDAPNFLESGGGAVLTDMWVTAATPADNSGNADAGDYDIVLEPPRAGTVFRTVELPPDGERWGKGIDPADAFARMGASHAMDDTAEKRHPGMHKTSTVDYIIVLSGEVYAVMDEGETLMRPGDCLIQRGTNHAWSNRTNEPCLLAAILVGAEPV